LYLENKIHSWAESHSKIYVISGVVLDADNDGHRDKDSLYSQWTNGSGSAAVPSHFFTIITFCNHKSIASIAECPVDDLNVVVLMTINTNSIIPEGYEDNYLKERLTTIRELETITGIDFFPNLSVSDQNRMELRIVLTLDFN
jgi:ectonucleotide pyrophosphatase/phosphodiesterase family protein 1/3